MDLLDRSIQDEATVVAIGSYTNLALLEVARPGCLDRVPVVAMGGWTGPPADGLPAWGPERDHNVQFDTRAAQILATAATELTLVTLPVTLKAHLRAADLPRLRASGPLGELLARQGEAHGEDRKQVVVDDGEGELQPMKKEGIAHACSSGVDLTMRYA